MPEQSNITTERFLLRELNVNDATDRYLSWLSDESANKYIVSASNISKRKKLEEFICDKNGRKDILFYGIFDKKTGQHIGNLKYEPVNEKLGYAIMGILIGEPKYRGMGVAAEVLIASGEWLQNHRNINQIVLGVDNRNNAAIRAYKKVGFSISDTPYIQPSLGNSSMVWNLS